MFLNIIFLQIIHLFLHFDIETEMTKYLKKIGILLLLLSTATNMMAQKLSFQSLSVDLQSLQKQLVPDKRIAILEVELKDTVNSIIVVCGRTDLPAAKDQIIKMLNDRNVSFVDSIRVLPNALLGDKIWALATLSVSNMRSKPDDASELVSQAIMGTPMKVLDVKDKWYRVQTPENYIGWMEGCGLQRMSSLDFEHWEGAKRFLFNRMTGNAFDAPCKKGEIISDLVLGDLFEVEDVVHNFLKIKMPDGRVGYVHRDDCISFEDWCKIKPNAQSILAVAKQMMGSPYLWGGLSSKAVDCSGLVKLAYYSQGVILARDASQQVRCGEIIDFQNISNLQSGDLLFFGPSAQRIKHVGIYLSNGDFIHSSGRVHISSIIPTDPKYVATRHLVASTRVLNSLDSEGVVSVGKHPWYSIQH